jgi:DNA-binding beta-propeller fold protein YncE
MWLLAKAHGATTLQELDLTDDAIKVVLPAPGDAGSLAQSASGVAGTSTTLPSVPVPGDTTATVVDRAGRNLYALEENGSVTQISLQNGSVVSRWTKPYLLERSGALSDVAVVNLATEQVSTRIPAPRYCVGIRVSADDEHIYEIVGTTGTATCRPSH